MNILRRFLGAAEESSDKKTSAEMTEHRVDMSFRIFWTKICREWDSAHIQSVRAQVLAIIQAPNFEKNLIDRRYQIDDLVEGGEQNRHSGASLLALIEVLDTLEHMRANEQEDSSS